MIIYKNKIQSAEPPSVTIPTVLGSKPFWSTRSSIICSTNCHSLQPALPFLSTHCSLYSSPRRTDPLIPPGTPMLFPLPLALDSESFPTFRSQLWHPFSRGTWSDPWRMLAICFKLSQHVCQVITLIITVFYSPLNCGNHPSPSSSQCPQGLAGDMA